MHFRPGFLLLMASLAMQAFLLIYVWQKDVVHTGIALYTIAIPFVVLLMLAVMMSLRARTEKRDYLLLLVSTLFGCSLPVLFSSSAQLLNYGSWIRAGMPVKQDAPLLLVGFLLLEIAIILGLRLYLKRIERNENNDS
jgi:hypothetical protein